ncbi:MAG: ATPase, T2SS/T4P/T4SS family [Kiritimatiellae bacterium]|nr:ATPase, T2SS/T4P/T4SS family [Kiritimatiellia bacterium]MDD4734486.1 ATPase, T2SS/T4P/T4SS family [Kiritimatiellia bacterium]
MITASHNQLVKTILKRTSLEAHVLNTVQAESEQSGVALEKILLDKQLITEYDLILSMGEYLDIRPITLDDFTPHDVLMELLPKATWKQFGMLPIARIGKMLTVATCDPFNVPDIENVQAQTGLDVVILVATEKEINRVLDSFTKEPAQALEDILKDMANDDEIEVGENAAEDTSLDEMMESAEDAPVIRIVNSILIEALRKKASDIHIEPMEKSIRLRYRVDGILYENPKPPKSLQNAIISRIKIMSNLNIAERRVPQDGRFKIKALGKEVDLRVSILPTVHGEKIVMRTLDKSSLAPNLAALHLRESDYEKLMFAISQPHGMLLVTGPTGSGKTTTLYSALQELNQPDVNIITVEDPVEYQLPGINQVQTHAEVGLTFAAGLRSILRQDPDIVLIGEIRDNETGSIAVQAALTGHLVLSTLHTNDAAGAVARLAYMGIEPFLLASSLIMTQAQRLYRKLCPTCKRITAFPEETLRKNRLDPEKFREASFYEAVGCPKCANMGYKGRGALMEILLLSERLRHTILESTDANVIRNAAIEEGMATLRDVGLTQAEAGVSTIEEILRVTTSE